jgi:hypothetical protein
MGAGRRWQNAMVLDRAAGSLHQRRSARMRVPPFFDALCG